MNYLHRLTIKKRLLMGYALITLALVLVAAMGIRGQSVTQNKLMYQVNTQNTFVALSNDLMHAASARAVSARNLAISTTPADIEAETKLIMAAHSKVGERLQKLQDMLKDMHEDSRVKLSAHVQKIAATEAAYAPVALEITRLGGIGERDQAIQKINTECRPLLAQLISQITALVGEEKALAALEATHSQQEANALRLQTAIIRAC